MKSVDYPHLQRPISRHEAHRLANGDIVLFEPASCTLTFLNRDMAYSTVAAMQGSPAEIDALLATTTPYEATCAIRRICDTHSERITDTAYVTLAEVTRGMRNHGYTHLFRSPTDRDPPPLTPRQTSKALERELCGRDNDCVGQHRWLAVSRQYDILIWHLNTTTALVVPPTPLVLQP